MSDRNRLPDTVPERIKFLRTMKGFKTATEAARAFGWTVSTYLGYENGDREPSKKMAARIADAFGVTISYLLIGEGLIFEESDETFKIPVVADVCDFGEVSPGVSELPVEGYYTISTRIPTLNASIAVRVTGASMWPRYENGDALCFVLTGQRPCDLSDGCEAVVRLENGVRLIKKVYKANSPEKYHLQGHNSPPMLNQSLIWASEISAVIRSTNILTIDASLEARDQRRRRIARTAQSEFFGEIGANDDEPMTITPGI